MDQLTRAGDGEQRPARQGTGARGPTSEVASSSERSASQENTSPTESWTTAALSHASILLTLLLSFAGGVGALAGLAAPLAIYLSNRERSRFIAFQAVQSLVYQTGGILIYLLLAMVLGLTVTLAWTVSGVLSAVAAGFLVMPWALLITILTVALLVGAPLAWVGYGLYAAYRVYQGDDFRYLVLGDWVEREVMG